MALIVLAIAAALWFFVFPWASVHLPIDTVPLKPGHASR